MLPHYREAIPPQGLISLKRNQLGEAEELLTKRLGLRPDRVRRHYYHTHLYEEKVQYRRAMKHYRDVLNRCPSEF